MLSESLRETCETNIERPNWRRDQQRKAKTGGETNRERPKPKEKDRKRKKEDEANRDRDSESEQAPSKNAIRVR